MTIMKRFLPFISVIALLAFASPSHADIYLWSQTPANNTNSDLSDDINWVEGMAPSEVNDSARAMMAEIRKWIDDQGFINGSALQTTAGSANAQTLTTNLTTSTLVHGHKVCFVVGGGLTNTGATTLNVDSLGAVAVQGVDGTALAGGELAAGTAHCAVYDSNATAVWLLENFRPVDTTSISFNSTGQLQRNALTGDITASAGSSSTSLAADSVDSAEIATDAVGSTEIATDAVGSAEIAADAVGTSEIATDGVDSAEIAADAVTASEIATDAVGSAEIAADAVGASEIATGAVGSDEIATDAVDSAEIAADAVGSSELAAAVEPGIILLETGTISAATTKNWVLTSWTTYRAINWKLSCTTDTDVTQFALRTSTNGGSSYDSGVADYAHLIIGDNVGSGTADSNEDGSDDHILLAPKGVGSAAGEGMDVNLWLYDQTDTARYTTFNWSTSYFNAGGNLSNGHGVGTRLAAADVDAVQLTSQGGTAALSCDYAVYGAR